MLRKFAASWLISAEIAGTTDLRKTAAQALGASEYIYDRGLYKASHRVDFEGMPRREGFLYVRNRAISSRTNDNWDTWPAEEIADTTPGFGYLTFIGKPVFVEHANDNHRHTRGVNIAVALHQDRNPDGTPDTWVEVLKEIDPVSYPKLAKAILAGRVNRTSMGADVGYSVCSKCGNTAMNTTEYCAHIPNAKGARFETLNVKTGRKEPRIITEICRKIAFFEDTFIVTTPADPTAFVLGIEGEGVAKTSSRRTASDPSVLDLLEQRRQRPIRPDTHTPEKHPYSFTPEYENKVRMQSTPHRFETEDPWAQAVSGTANRWCKHCSYPKDDPVHRVIHSASEGWSPQTHCDCPRCNQYYSLDHDAGEDDKFWEHPEKWEPAWGHDSGKTPHWGLPNNPRTSSLQVHGAKEIVLPPKVDTLSHDICPVCGSENSFVGDRCSVCNGMKPPEAFMDPDTSVAGQVQDIIEPDEDEMGDEDMDLDTAPDLECDNCGEQFHSAEQDEEAGNPYLAPAANTQPESAGLAEDADDMMAEQEAGDASPDEAAKQDADKDQDPDEEGPEGAKDNAEAPQDEEEQEPGDNDGAPPGVDEQDEESPEEAAEGELEEEAAADEVGEADTGYAEGDTCPACGSGTLQALSPEEQALSAEENPLQGDEGDEPEEDAGEDNGSPSPDSDSESPGAEDGSSYGDDDVEDEDDSADKTEDTSPGPDEDESDEDNEKPRPRRKGAARMSEEVLRNAINTQAARIKELSDGLEALNTDREAHLGAFRKQSALVRRQAALIETLQVRCEAAERQLAHIATVAGQEEALVAIGRVAYRRVGNILANAGMTHTANPANPAQPIAEPGSEAPIVTKDQAMEPAARADVTTLGATPESDVSADATIDPTQPYGTYADVPVGANRVDVTAPVAGTEVQRPPSETIIPVDVRIGDPDNPNPAFPWTMGPVGQPSAPTPPGPSVGNPPTPVRSQGNKRAFQTLRLAKLQIEAGMVRGDELEVAASLDSSGISDEILQDRIDTLTQAQAARTVSAPPPGTPGRRLVPKAAAAEQPPYMGVEGRSQPSMASMTNPQAPKPQGAAIGDDEFAFA